MNLLHYLIAAVTGYLIGSVPFAFIVAKQAQGIDIREHGSGNVGATNVMRVVGKKAGILVLFLDGLKGLIPILLFKHWIYPGEPYVHVLLALALILGHSRSVYLKFSGGKSAITGLGGMLALMPAVAILTGIVAYTVSKLTRFVSVGSLSAAACALTVAIILHNRDPFHYPLAYTLYVVAAALYITYLHRGNIQRLFSGSENRI